MEMIYYPPAHAEILSPVDVFLFHVALFETIASSVFTTCMLMKCELFVCSSFSIGGFTKSQIFHYLGLIYVTSNFSDSHVSISSDTFCSRMLKRKSSWVSACHWFAIINWDVYVFLCCGLYKMCHRPPVQTGVCYIFLSRLSESPLKPSTGLFMIVPRSCKSVAHTHTHPDSMDRARTLTEAFTVFGW